MYLTDQVPRITSATYSPAHPAKIRPASGDARTTSSTARDGGAPPRRSRRCRSPSSAAPPGAGWRTVSNRALVPCVREWSGGASPAQAPHHELGVVGHEPGGAGPGERVVGRGGALQVGHRPAPPAHGVRVRLHPRVEHHAPRCPCPRGGPARATRAARASSTRWAARCRAVRRRPARAPGRRSCAATAAQRAVDHDPLRGDPEAAFAELADQALVDLGHGHLAQSIAPS